MITLLHLISFAEGFISEHDESSLPILYAEQDLETDYYQSQDKV